MGCGERKRENGMTRFYSWERRNWATKMHDLYQLQSAIWASRHRWFAKWTDVCDPVHINCTEAVVVLTEHAAHNHDTVHDYIIWPHVQKRSSLDSELWIETRSFLSKFVRGVRYDFCWSSLAAIHPFNTHWHVDIVQRVVRYSICIYPRLRMGVLCMA